MYPSIEIVWRERSFPGRVCKKRKINKMKKSNVSFEEGRYAHDPEEKHLEWTVAK